MARIGLITGGDVFAREVFANERRGYWSQALPLALEKHGVLGMETLGPDSLAQPEELERFDAVLVARLPDDAWSPGLAERLADGSVPILVEGPLPADCVELLGVESLGAIEERGWITPLGDELIDLTRAYGPAPYGEVRATIGRPLQRPAELDWPALDTSIEATRADAWQAPGWEFERWQVTGDGTPIAEWMGAENKRDRFPAIVERGSLAGCSLSMFAYLGQAHTSAPFPPSENHTSPRVTALEAILLALIDRMHGRRGATRARVMPWPGEARWVRSVRHDYDRPLTAEQTRVMLAGHERVGSAATWYWRSRHAGDDALGLVAAADDRHEIALHVERAWAGAEEERAEVERAAGVQMLGTSAHGAADCSRFQGAPSVLWSERQGFRYTELLQHPHLHPHRFAFLGPDGTIAPLEIVCLPHHESFDRSTSSDETFAEAIDRALPLWMGSGGMCQIMNHPDINEEAFLAYLDSMPVEGRLDWTAAQTADWWARTHVRGRLALKPAGAGRFRVEAEQPVEDLVVELLEPDGTRHEQTVHAGPDRMAVVSQDGVIDSWEGVSEVFGAAIREYHSSRGRDASSASVTATVRTNTELVPKRAENVVKLLTQMTGRDISDLRVLELGCGFGALATYLAWAAGPRELVATDIRADFVQTAQGAAEQLGLSDRLRFVEADMRNLTETVGDRPFDVLIANNSFIYLPTAGDVRAALQSFHEVLAPGGRVFFYHANKWRLREPFTNDPLVHLLPPRLGRPAAKAFGWKHNHGRVRLLSPVELRRRLKRAGFADTRVSGVGAKRDAEGVRRFFGNFYALSARRPT